MTVAITEEEPSRLDDDPTIKGEPGSLLRVCPLCAAETTGPYCDVDGMATLLLDPPCGVRIRNVELGAIVGGRYRIESRIGTGGFAAVYGARHLGTGQRVAVKVLAGGPEDDRTALRRFFREARVTAGLLHPNTIRVFDFGQDDTGLVYLAMELLTGCTLGQEMKKRLAEDRAFSERETIDIAIEILRSLGEAHALGLVHRDLTPGNVYLLDVLGDQRRLVKVLDFGIVKGGGEPLTRRAVCMGTMSFSSPEASRYLELDGRADLYALGVLMYWMLAGETPFGVRAPAELLRAHSTEAFPDLSIKARAPVSPELLEVIDRATQKDRELRFQDAAAMREALESIGAASVLLLTAPRIQRPIKPRVTSLALLGSLIVGFGAVVGFASALEARPDPPIVIAVEPMRAVEPPDPVIIIPPVEVDEPAPEEPKKKIKPRTTSPLKKRI